MINLYESQKKSDFLPKNKEHVRFFRIMRGLVDPLSPLFLSRPLFNAGNSHNVLFSILGINSLRHLSFIFY